MAGPQSGLAAEKSVPVPAGAVSLLRDAGPGMFTPVVRVAGIYLVSLGLTALIRRIPVVGRKLT